jgi:Fe-S-cluster containining protein
MSNITGEDIRLMAGPLCLTSNDLANPVYVDIRAMQCNRCGACCKTQNSVRLSLFDIFNLSNDLHLPPKNFIRKYCRETSNYDLLGMGPFKGISIATGKGICPFFREGTGCSVNMAKPLICRMYPFTDVSIGRACQLKMFRKKDGAIFDGCSVHGLANNAAVIPDFEIMAFYYVHMKVTQEYLGVANGRWHEDQARDALYSATTITGDKKKIESYTAKIEAVFHEIDKNNVAILLEALSPGQ